MSKAWLKIIEDPKLSVAYLYSLFHSLPFVFCSPFTISLVVLVILHLSYFVFPSFSPFSCSCRFTFSSFSSFSHHFIPHFLSSSFFYSIFSLFNLILSFIPIIYLYPILITSSSSPYFFLALPFSLSLSLLTSLIFNTSSSSSAVPSVPFLSFPLLTSSHLSSFNPLFHSVPSLVHQSIALLSPFFLLFCFFLTPALRFLHLCLLLFLFFPSFSIFLPSSPRFIFSSLPPFFHLLLHSLLLLIYPLLLSSFLFFFFPLSSPLSPSSFHPLLRSFLSLYSPINSFPSLIPLLPLFLPLPFILPSFITPSSFPSDCRRLGDSYLLHLNI